MKFKESHLYAAVIAILLIAVLGVVYHAAGKSIQEINRDRMINRIFATQTFFKMDSDHRVKMQTLTFAIKGMESRGENTTAIKKWRDQSIIDFQKLEADYNFFMEQNKPIRSIFPPFLKEFPELQNPNILLYKLKED